MGPIGRCLCLVFLVGNLRVVLSFFLGGGCPKPQTLNPVPEIFGFGLNPKTYDAECPSAQTHGVWESSNPNILKHQCTKGSLYLCVCVCV